MNQGLDVDRTAVTLADFAGESFGDLTPDDESPESAGTGDAAGAPPAELPAATPVATPGPEGTPPLTELAGAPPADAVVVAPDPSAPVVEIDPLASATPLTYTVNGEQRTYEGIKVLGEDGAIVDAAALPDLMRRLGERDHLFETNKAQYQRVQSLEKLSKWVTTGVDGKEQTFEGERGLYEMRLQLVRQAVENEAMSALLQDPDKLVALLTQDENNKITFDPDKLETLSLRMRAAQREALDAAREQLSSMVRPAPAAPAAPDFAKIGPSLIENAAKAAGADHTALTPADRALLVQQLPRYVRAVTEQDRRDGEQRAVGSPIIDRSFVDLVKHQVATRAEQKVEAVKIATATTAATQRNAAAIAAAARTSVAPAAPIKATPAPAEPAENPSHEKWDFMQKLATPARR